VTISDPVSDERDPQWHFQTLAHRNALCHIGRSVFVYIYNQVERMWIEMAMTYFKVHFGI